MPRSPLPRILRVSALCLVAALSLAQGAAACETCKRTSWLTPWNYMCWPAVDGESGTMLCDTERNWITEISSCNQSGMACEVITVYPPGGSGSGTGGTGSGGDNPCQAGNFCPAECFTCGGGGGGGAPAT